MVMSVDHRFPTQLGIKSSKTSNGSNGLVDHGDDHGDTLLNVGEMAEHGRPEPGQGPKGLQTLLDLWSPRMFFRVVSWKKQRVD